LDGHERSSLVIEMSEYPLGVTREDLSWALLAIRNMRLTMVSRKMDPRACTIALWFAVQCDMMVGLQRISDQEYKVLADYGKRLALKTGKEWIA